MNSIHVHPNILKPWKGTHLTADVAGWTLRQVAREFAPRAWGTSPIRCAVNGLGYPERRFDEITVGPGDDVIVSQDVLGIGEALVGAGIAAVLIDVGLAVALNIGISYAIQALQGRPRAARTLSDRDSPTYRLAGGIATSYGSGLKIGLPYGKVRVGGQVLSQYLHELGTRDDVYSVLLALGRGPVAQIAGIDLTNREEYNRLGSLYGSQFGIQPIPSGIRVNRVEISAGDSSVSLRAGTFHQSPVGGNFHRGTTLSNVDKPLRAGAQQSFPIATTTQRVRVRIVFESCFTATSSAAITTKAVFFSLTFHNASGQQVGNTFTPQVVEAQRNPFAYSFIADVPATATTVRLVRTTADDDLQSASSCSWAQLAEEFNSVDLSYPGIALLGLDARATEQISGSVSDITVPMWGRLLRWRDSGAWQDPAFFHTPTGRWIGRNPAWVAADFLTSRYGLGLFVDDSMLNLQAFEDWGDHNDILVDDGHGGQHPQFHCDVVVDQGRKALSWLFDICATGRAFPYWFGNRIDVKFQRASTSVAFPNPLRMIIAESNCAELRIESTEIRHRPTIYDAQIPNEEKDFELDPITVTDPGAITDPTKLNFEPAIRTNREMVGVVRPQQAKRDLLYEHAVNRLRTWVATGLSGIDIATVEPGDLFGIQQDFPRWFGTDTGGWRTTRAGAGVTNVYLDHAVTLAPATTYEVLIRQTDGVPVLCTVTAAPGTYPADTAISVSVPTPPTTLTYPKAAVIAFGIQNKVVRVFEMREFEFTEDLQVRWRAQIWDDAVFTQPTPQPNDDLGSLVQSPFSAEGSQVVSEVVAVPAAAGGGGQVVGWRYPDGNKRRARVYVRDTGRLSNESGGVLTDPYADQGWARVYEGEASSIAVDGLSPFHEHEVAVVLADRDGRWGAPSDSAVRVTPEEFPPLPPPSLQGLRASRTEAGPELRWTPVEGVRDYEVRRGSVWLGGQLVARTTEPRLLVADAPVGGQTYLVAARAHNGLYSPVIAQVSVNVDPPAAWPAADVTVLDLAPAAGGTHDGTEFAADGSLQLQHARICGIYTMPTIDPGRTGPYWWSLNWSWRWRDISGDALLVAVGSGESHWWRSGPDGDGREPTLGKPGVDFDLRLDGDGVIGSFSPGFSDGFATGPDDIYSRPLSATDGKTVTFAGPFGAVGAHARVVAEVRWDDGTGTFGKWERWRNQVRTAARAQIRFLLDRVSASRFEVFLDPWVTACACAKTFSAELSFTGADGPQQRFTIANPAVRADSRIVGNVVRPNVTEEEDDGTRYSAQVLSRQNGAFDLVIGADGPDGTEAEPVPSEAIEYHYVIG